MEIRFTSFILIKCLGATRWLVAFYMPQMNVWLALLQKKLTWACLNEENIPNSKLARQLSQVNVLWPGALATKVILWLDIVNWANWAVLKESCTVADITVTQIFWESGLFLFHELLITGSSWREEKLCQDFFFLDKKKIWKWQKC